MMKERTLAHIVENYYRRGAETAFVYRRGYRSLRWSYRQVAECAYGLARDLEDRGIGRGDRVFLWGDDCPEWVAGFWATILRGAVAVPMDRGASADFARRVRGQAGVRLCLCSRRQPSAGPSIPALAFEDFPKILARRSLEPVAPPDIEDQDAAEMVFTSGTTAEPKGVLISHRNILANLEPLEKEIGKYLKFERIVHPLRFLNLLPLSHVFGQFLGLFIPQIMGSTVVFHDTLNPSEILRTIKREKISVLVTVPRIMQTLRDKIERDLELEGRLKEFRKNFDKAEGERFLRRWWRFRAIHRRFGWRYWAFISGGASLDPGTEQFWGRLGYAVIQGYGLTETTSMISINHPLRPGHGSVGKILPGREVRLAPDGEILVRGESIAKGYYQAGETRPVSVEEGWFHTGDLGSLDEHGNLYFKGRRKNVIVSSEGMNLYPKDLEAALKRQPEVRDCVVLEIGGVNPEACAVLILHGSESDPAAVIGRANETLAGFQHIRRWLVWPERDFPRTPTQKPQAAAIQEYVDAHLGRDATKPGGQGTLADMIARITGRSAVDISPGSSLARDLGLTSMEQVELLSALEDRFQLDLDESRFTSASTLGDIEELLNRPTRPGAEFRYPRWAQRAPVAALRMLVYYLLCGPATWILARPRVRGRENLRDMAGPALFVCNHVTQVDIGFVLAAVPARFRHRLAVAMMGEMLRDMRDPPPGMSFFRRWIEKISYGLVVALFNVFPLPQKAGFRRSFAFAGESADRGCSILVFPEGTRTKDGTMGPFRTGTGLLAADLDLPVAPLRIDGLFELKQARKKFARPGSVIVTIGPAVRYDRGTNAMKITSDLRNRVMSL